MKSDLTVRINDETASLSSVSCSSSSASFIAKTTTTTTTTITPKTTKHNTKKKKPKKKNSAKSKKKTLLDISEKTAETVTITSSSSVVQFETLARRRCCKSLKVCLTKTQKKELWVTQKEIHSYENRSRKQTPSPPLRSSCSSLEMLMNLKDDDTREEEEDEWNYWDCSHRKQLRTLVVQAILARQDQFTTTTTTAEKEEQDTHFEAWIAEAYQKHTQGPFEDAQTRGQTNELDIAVYTRTSCCEEEEHGRRQLVSQALVQNGFHPKYNNGQRQEKTSKKIEFKPSSSSGESKKQRKKVSRRASMDVLPTTTQTEKLSSHKNQHLVVKPNKEKKGKASRRASMGAAPLSPEPVARRTSIGSMFSSPIASPQPKQQQKATTSTARRSSIDSFRRSNSADDLLWASQRSSSSKEEPPKHQRASRRSSIGGMFSSSVKMASSKPKQKASARRASLDALSPGPQLVVLPINEPATSAATSPTKTKRKWRPFGSLKNSNHKMRSEGQGSVSSSSSLEEEETDYGYGVALPDTKVDYGYGVAAPDSEVDYGYGAAVPDTELEYEPLKSEKPKQKTARRSSIGNMFSSSKQKKGSRRSSLGMFRSNSAEDVLSVSQRSEKESIQKPASDGRRSSIGGRFVSHDGMRKKRFARRASMGAIPSNFQTHKTKANRAMCRSSNIQCLSTSSISRNYKWKGGDAGLWDNLDNFDQYLESNVETDADAAPTAMSTKVSSYWESLDDFDVSFVTKLDVSDRSVYLEDQEYAEPTLPPSRRMSCTM